MTSQLIIFTFLYMRSRIIEDCFECLQGKMLISAGTHLPGIEIYPHQSPYNFHYVYDKKIRLKL